MKTPTKKAVKKAQDGYTVSLKIFGKTYTAQGDSILEALKKLEPGIARGVSILTVKKGGVSKDRVLYPRQTARLFNGGGTIREASIKSISMLFDL